MRTAWILPPLRMLLWVVSLVSAAPAMADATSDVIESALRLEAQGLALLRDQYDFEQALMAQDPARLAVYLVAPGAASAGLEEAALFLDGKPAVRHRYSPADLDRLNQGAAHPLFVGATTEGEHTLRIEVRVRGARNVSTASLRLIKGSTPRFVELTVQSDAARSVRVGSW